MGSRFCGALAVLGLAAAICTASATAGPWTVVASGLNNPRGLTFADEPGGDYTLYVAEAGRGGPGPCGIALGGETACYGPTGSITKITGLGQQRRIATGLPSIAGPGGFGAAGPQDVAVWDGRLYVPIGYGGTAAGRPDFGPFATGLGTLARVLLPGGSWSFVADLAAYEAANNPDGNPEDVTSNPDASLVIPGHRFVIDAAGNDLLDVQNERPGFTSSIALDAVFPIRLVPAPPFLGLPPGAMIPMDPVPTSMVLGPDGALYVGELTGFPFPVGGARVYRLERHLASFGPPTVYASGFTNIIDLAFDDEGRLNVLEFQKNGLLSDDPTGALIRVNANGSQTEIASTGLVNPGGLAIGDGDAYVSNKSVFPGGGEVVRIPLP